MIPRDDQFRTSSHSGGDNGSQCVEVALLAGQPSAWLRDSKARRGPALRLPAAALAGLVAFAAS